MGSPRALSVRSGRQQFVGRLDLAKPPLGFLGGDVTEVLVTVGVELADELAVPLPDLASPRAFVETEDPQRMAPSPGPAGPRASRASRAS